jgi:DNA-binding MarR family transcriptional regulator
MDNRGELEKKVINSLNTEFKSFLVGFLLTDEYQSAWQMQKKAVRIVDPNLLPSDWKNYEGPLIEGEKRGSVLAHFIDKHRHGEKRSRSFRLNEIAQESHLSDIARFMMYAPIKFHMSAWSWLGQSQRDGPYHTARILEELATRGILRRRDLEINVGITEGALKEKLNKLEDLELLRVLSFTPNGDGQIYWTWNGSAKKPANNFKQTRTVPRVLDYIASHTGPFTYKDVQEALNYKQHRWVESALKALERTGHIKRVSPWEGGVRYSMISITPRGRKLYKDVIGRIFRWLRERDIKALEYIKRKHVYKENIPVALDQYNAMSASTKALSSKERKQQIMNILGDKPTSYKSIESALGVKASRYLQELVQENAIKKVGRGIYEKI